MKYISIILLIVSQYLGYSQSLQVRLERINSNQGLSHNAVTCITQDSRGFLWFGTEDGLDRYDGYNFEVFKKDATVTNSISDNFVNCILYDKKNRLWTGTSSGGLCLFDPEKKGFKIYRHNEGNKESLISDNITYLYEDREHRIWVGTGKGLDLFDPQTGKCKHYVFNIGPNYFQSVYITAIFEDQYKNLWIGTQNDLAKVNVNEIDKGHFRFYLHDNLKPKSICNNIISSIFADNKGMLWIGTQGGLSKYNQLEDNFTNFQRDLKNKNSLGDNYVHQIIQDKKGLFWLSTSTGLTVFDQTKNDYFRFNSDPNNIQSLSNDLTQTIFEDNTGIIWVGTKFGGLTKIKRNKSFNTYFSGKTIGQVLHSKWDLPNIVWVASAEKGLLKYDRNTNTILEEFNQAGNKNKLSDNTINAIYEDTKGNIWLATWNGGLNHIIFKPLAANEIGKKDRKIDKIEVYMNDPKNPFSIHSNTIQSILEDKQGRIWMGSFAGLDYFDPDEKKFYNFHHETNNINSICDNNVQGCLIQDRKGDIWVGTWNGLNKITIASKNKKITAVDLKIERFQSDPSNKKSISENKVISIWEDVKGTIWIGTYGGGINKMIENKNAKNKSERYSFQKFMEVDGLPNNSVYGIKDDENGNLWISTNDGLARFSPEKSAFHKFDVNDGLQGNQFFWRASSKDYKGELFFGGINGLNSFFPSKIEDDTISPKIAVTSFKIFNKEVKIGENSKLIKDISETKEIILNYKDLFFSFDFSALHFSDPQKNQYEYKMVGFDDHWNKTNSQRRYATYTNLDPGKYTFRVRASNCDDIWNKDGVSIHIIIYPPFWKTWWFRILFLAIILGSIYMYFNNRIKNIQEQKDELERQVKERTLEISIQNKEIKEINQRVMQQNEEIMSQTELLETQNIELEKLSIVASKSSNAVAIMNAQGDIEWCNNGYDKLYELNEMERIGMRGKNITEISSNSEMEHILKECTENKKSVVFESNIETSNSKNIWIQTTISPVLDSNNEITKLISIDSDITPIKDQELQIIQKSEVIARQNDQIWGSMRYAKTIQSAILPSSTELSKRFEHFVIYKPKDIVSGDFYWFYEIELKPKEDSIFNFGKVIVASVDCTGHGVPGAFMSMIGNTLMNQIVIEKGIHDPVAILESLDEAIRISLRQDVSENNDGMDVCLCCFENINDEFVEVKFVGAKRPLFYYSGKDNFIQTIKSSRRRIGGVKTTPKEDLTNTFECNQFNLYKGDLVYLCSDGYIDQNDFRRKRLGSKRFIEILEECQMQTMERQKTYIEDQLLQFQKNEMQRDDITILGIKL